mgnify:FL=1
MKRLHNKPGFAQSALDAINTKVKTLNAEGRLCIISFDEMSLKSNVIYQSNTDELIGLEDLGDGNKTNSLATSAIVFMARGLVENWKQPLAYYLVNESCGSEKVKEKLEDVIKKVEKIGLNVVAVISDIGSNFQKLIREMGITPDKPWFIHNGKKIYYLYDPPHIIKAVRNNLIKYDYHFDGKVASWRDIIALYNIDSKNEYRCCPKLTNQHVFPNGFQKMKVKYATQVLSHSVSAAMLLAVSGNLLPPSATGTAELVSHFDKTFDCLNSSTFKSHKPHNRPMTKDTKHCDCLKEMCLFTKKIEVKNPATGKDVTSNLRCLKALEMTLNGTFLLWQSLQSSYPSIKFLCTRRLNQDPLENFFGCIRQQGGNSDNPTPVQFTRAFRKLFFDNLLSSTTGNCAEDLDSILVGSAASSKGDDQPNSILESNSSMDETHVVQPFNLNDTDYRLPDVEEHLMRTNALTYVAGYLLKKCMQKHRCEACLKCLIHDELDDPSKLLCHFKAYDERKGPFGSLIAPTGHFVQYINNIEQIFVKEFDNSMTKIGVGQLVVNALPEYNVPECTAFPSKYLVKLFVRMRIHYLVKFRNRELAKTTGPFV